MEEIRRILVISRVTKDCKMAVHYGISLARSNKASLCVFHSTYDPFEAEGWYLSLPSARDMGMEYRSAQDEARKQLDDMIATENADGMPIEVIVSNEDPQKEIYRIVKEKGIDLIILRSHEEGRIEHFFFGSSNVEILRKMPCSVLFIKDESMTERST